MSVPGALKHLAVLRDKGVVISERAAVDYWSEVVCFDNGRETKRVVGAQDKDRSALALSAQKRTAG